MTTLERLKTNYDSMLVGSNISQRASDALWAEVEEIIKALFSEQYEIDQILGRALGYPEADETIGGKPGEPGNPVITGEHTPVTLSMEAAHQVKRVGRIKKNIEAALGKLKEMGFIAPEDRSDERLGHIYTQVENYLTLCPTCMGTGGVPPHAVCQDCKGTSEL